VQKFLYPDVMDPRTHVQEVDDELEYLMHQLVDVGHEELEGKDVKDLKASKAACFEQKHIFVHTLSTSVKEDL
jgi:hypothetical protein